MTAVREPILSETDATPLLSFLVYNVLRFLSAESLARRDIEVVFVAG